MLVGIESKGRGLVKEDFRPQTRMDKARREADLLDERAKVCLDLECRF
jgi:hypothetical protein